MTYLIIFDIIRKYQMLPWCWSNQVYGPKNIGIGSTLYGPVVHRNYVLPNVTRAHRTCTIILFRRRRVCWPLVGGWMGGNHNNNTTSARTPAGRRRRWFFVTAARACMRRVAVLAAELLSNSPTANRSFRVCPPFLSYVDFLFCSCLYRASVSSVRCLSSCVGHVKPTRTIDRHLSLSLSFCLTVFPTFVFVAAAQSDRLKNRRPRANRPSRTCAVSRSAYAQPTISFFFTIVIMSTTPKSLPEESLGGKYTKLLFLFICLFAHDNIAYRGGTDCTAII